MHLYHPNTEQRQARPKLLALLGVLLIGVGLPATADNSRQSGGNQEAPQRYEDTQRYHQSSPRYQDNSGYRQYDGYPNRHQYNTPNYQDNRERERSRQDRFQTNTPNLQFNRNTFSTPREEYNNKPAPQMYNSPRGYSGQGYPGQGWGGQGYRGQGYQISPAQAAAIAQQRYPGQVLNIRTADDHYQIKMMHQGQVRTVIINAYE